METTKRFTVCGIAKAPNGKIVDRFFIVLTNSTEKDAQALAQDYEEYYALRNVNAVAKVNSLKVFHEQ